MNSTVCAQLFAILGFIAQLEPCVAYPAISATGFLANTPVSTTVDSELAKEYLAISSNHSAGSESAAERIAPIEERFRGRPVDWLTLKKLSKATSPDFATIYFVRRCLADHTNELFQSAYANEFQRIKSLIRQRNWTGTVRNNLRGYEFLFIPGFHYITDPTSGADFLNQRTLMRELGIDVQLAPTQEDGTIEENAQIIAQTIRSQSRYHSKLILVSTSKSGPETALALGRILQPGETISVRAWISVGGLIRGTVLADRAVAWPQSWIVPLIFSLQGVSFRSVPGLTTRASRARMKSIRLPQHILLVDYVAAPLSGDIAEDVKSRYNYLRRYGPNDGLTLLADELLPGAVTIIEPGVDHFYRDPYINVKSLAVANVVADALNDRSSLHR
ncbi:MAG TPA: hypothetical protein VE860_19310 [Chthoniobacterales bacterium]|jgi:hypothetical protein|nr:hypothetical protein [Chthoniobacterales bacterium]